MQFRIPALQRTQEIRKVFEWQLGVETPSDVQLRCALGDRLAGNTQAVLDAVSIGIRLPRRTVKPAELAVGITNIRGIEMPINIEICHATMFSASNAIGECAQPGQVVCGIES